MAQGWRPRARATPPGDTPPAAILPRSPRPSQPARRTGPDRSWLLRWPGFAQCAAVAFLIGHLCVLVPFSTAGPAGNGWLWLLGVDLDDIDAVNFAMGVQDFDVTEHRPHPPGYPIYMLLGKLGLHSVGARSAAAASAAAKPASSAALNAAYATSLAFWGALAGALAAFPLFRLFQHITSDARVAAAGTIVTLTCPLFWYTASRPLTDVPGLAGALGVQAILAGAFARQHGWGDRPVTNEDLISTGRLIVIGAFAAGLIVGLRSQTVWLTLPLFALVIADRAGRGAGGAIVGAMLTFAFGVLIWLVPVASVSGGTARYWHAIWSQAGEDIEGVDMLLTSTAPARRLALNLYETFVVPWASLPLAIVVLMLAAIGALVLLRTSRRGLVLLTALVAPYLLFHLVYQENVTTRYALPLVPAVSLLCAVGAAALFRRLGSVAAVGIAIASLWISVPGVVRAGSPHAPVFRLFSDFAARPIAHRPAEGERRPVVAMHRRLFTETRRAREWVGPDGFPWRLLAAPRGHEWLELVSYWRGGGAGPVYFVADPNRTDLALIDPRSRQARGRYGWPFAYRPTFVGGARPNEMDWVVIDGTPGWFLGEGWALTPETAGVANEDGSGPASKGAVGWLLRRSGALRLVLGGRNLGVKGEAPVRFTAALDGRTLETWDVAPAPGFFLRALELPPGALVGPADADEFAELQIIAAAADSSGRPVRASIEQFDAQAPDAVMFGYDEGWHEDEYNPRTGVRWRWSSDAATLRVWSPAGDVRVRISAESPLQTFDEEPIVTLKAGGRELVRMTPRAAFAVDVRVPAEALAASAGRLTLSTTRVFVPADHVTSSDARRNDRRRLGLQVVAIEVTRVQ